jgi:hypothetical protein
VRLETPHSRNRGDLRPTTRAEVDMTKSRYGYLLALALAGQAGAAGCGDDAAAVPSPDGGAGLARDDAGTRQRSPSAGEAGGCTDGEGCGCAPAELTGRLPLEQEVDTRDGNDARGGSCGGAGSPEAALRFVAPAAGRFLFSTAGSRFNTVLYALAGDCAGAELACNDDRIALESSFELELEAGESIVLVVDGFEGQAGRAVLRVEQLERSRCCEAALFPGCGSDEVEACVCALDPLCCTSAWDAACVEHAASSACGACSTGGGACDIDATLAGDRTTQSANLDGSTDAASASCGNAGAADVRFLFTANRTGTYTFATRGSTVSDTVLAILDGEGCGGVELACNDDDGSELASRVTVRLEAGQTVTAVVESWDEERGEVSLTVSTGTDAPSAACEPIELADRIPIAVTGEASGRPTPRVPSCALFGSLGEVTYAFVAPEAGTYRFDTSGSETDTVLQILDGACGGIELACNDDTDGGDLAAQLDLTLALGQSVVVGVSSVDGHGSYVLAIARVSNSLDGADCCEANAVGGCADPVVEACVCAEDSFCCEAGWDALCASFVEAAGCGEC